MNCVIIFALVAFASATPLVRWGDENIHYPEGENWSFYRHFYPERESWPSYQQSYGQRENHPFYQHSQKEVAHHVAEEVTHHALHEQLRNTYEAIQNLHRELEQHQGRYPQYHFGGETYNPYTPVTDRQIVQHREPEIADDVIQHLKDDMEHQLRQWTSPETNSENRVAHQLQSVLEAIVNAHLTTDDVRHQQEEQGLHVPVVAGLHSRVFWTRIQKLIDQHNVQEMETEISHHHHWAQQLHYQQEFISQQRHRIEAQLAVVRQQEVSPQHTQELEQALHHLHLQEYHWIQEQLAHHVACWTLQRALLHQEQPVEMDSVAARMQARTVQESHYPWSSGRSRFF